MLKEKFPNRRNWKNFAWAAASRKQQISSKPKISVVLPIYNQAEYLASAVKSIFQNKTCKIELIVVNDGSTDNINSVVTKLKQRYDFIYVEQLNAGLSAALNKGFSQATGTYITWTSADNLYQPGALDKMSDFLFTNPLVNLVYCNVRLIDEKNRPFKSSDYRPNDQSANDKSILLLPHVSESMFYYNDNFINACFLYRREALEVLGEYDVAKNGYEDYDFWLRIGSYSQIAHLDSESYYYLYRLHSNSMTHNLKSINLNKLQRPTVHYWASVREIVKGEKDFSLVMTSPKTEFSAIINRTNLKIEINESTKEFPCIYSDDPQINQNELFFKSLKDIETTPANLANYFEPENNHTQLIAAFSRANKNLCSASLQFPSLKIPQILKRSKDAYMGAVDRKKNSLANILFFAEDDLGKKDFDDKVDIFTELLHRHKNLTWALLLRTPSEREFVAKLRKQLKSVDNFRIIDISDQQNFTSLNPLQYEDEPWQERSMLYTLSAVDAVFEVMTDFSISSINRARAIYGICCSSGIKLNLLNFSKAHEIKINLSVEFNELLRSGYRLFTLGEKNILKIDADILKTENLIIHDIDDLNTYNSSNIIKELLMNVKDFNIDSAEQWLRKNTNNYNSDKILAHLLSSLSN